MNSILALFRYPKPRMLTHAIWLLALLDPLVLLVLSVFEPRTFDWFWGRSVVIVTAVKAFLVYFGFNNADGSGQSDPPSKAHKFHPIIPFAIVLYSVALYWFVGYLLTNAPELVISFHPSSERVAGSLTITTKADPTFRIDKDVRSGEPIQIKGVQVDGAYEVAFFPHDSDYYVWVEKSLPRLRFGLTNDTLVLSQKQFKVWFQVDPSEADIFLGDVKIPNEKVSMLMCNTYDVRMRVANFLERREALHVPIDCPDGIVRRKLEPERASVRFIANRGLGRKLLPVAGLFTIIEGGSIVQDGIQSDVAVSLVVGHEYTIRAIASDRWEERFYRGEGTSQQEITWVRLLFLYEKGNSVHP